MATSILTSLTSDKPVTKRTAPLVFGRCWVRPPLAFARTVTTGSPFFPQSGWPFWSQMGYAGQGNNTDAVDAIFLLGQAGLTIQGIRCAGTTVGLRRNDSGSWVSASTVVCGSSVESALKSMSAWLASQSSPGGTYGAKTYAPIQVHRASTSRQMDAGGAWSNLTPGAWAHLAGTPAEGLAYDQFTSLRFEGLPRKAGILAHSGFEVLVDGIGWDAGLGGCSPVDVVEYLLTELLGVPAGKVDTTDYATWIAAMPLFAVNAAVTDDGTTLLRQVLEATAAEIVPTADGGVRIVPLGDEAVGSYTPPSVAVLIDSGDLIDIVEADEAPESECPNTCTVNYTDAAANTKEQLSVRYVDDFDVGATYLREGPTIDSAFITSRAHAAWLAQWTVRKTLRNRKTCRLKVTPRLMALEQGDLIEVHDAHLPAAVWRITKRDITDAVGWAIDLEAEEWAGSVTPIDLTPDAPAGLTESTSTDEEIGAAVVANDASVVAGDAVTGLSGKADTDMTNVPDGQVVTRHLAALDPEVVAFSSLTVAKQLTALQLCDLSRPLASSTSAGHALALDDSGGNWLTIQSNRYLVNGVEAYVSTWEPTPYGDAIWDAARACFQACSNGSSGLQSIFPNASGTSNIYRRSGSGALCIGYGDGVVLATPDASTSGIYRSTNGTSYSTISLPITGYLQCLAYLGSSKWLVVGQNASNNVIVAYSSDGGASWNACSLPSNTGGTVASGRTSTTAPTKGVVCGFVAGRVLILTTDAQWSASVSSNLLLSGSWTKSSFSAMLLAPMRARATSSLLAVSFDASDSIAVTLDGINWRIATPTGLPGIDPSNGRVLSVAASQRLLYGTSSSIGRAQLAALVGTSAGSAARIVTSGQVNEWYD